MIVIHRANNQAETVKTCSTHQPRILPSKRFAWGDSAAEIAATRLPGNGSFTFATGVASGSPYAVTIKTQPRNPAQTCTVASGSGTIGTANVTNVAVNCSNDATATKFSALTPTPHRIPEPPAARAQPSRSPRARRLSPSPQAHLSHRNYCDLPAGLSMTFFDPVTPLFALALGEYAVKNFLTPTR
jgi:hypothetical protein